MSAIETSSSFEKAKEDGYLSPQEAKKILETPQGRETIQTPPMSDEFARRCCKSFQGQNDLNDVPNYHVKFFLPIFEKINSWLKMSPETKNMVKDTQNKIERKIFFSEIYPSLLPNIMAFETEDGNDIYDLYKQSYVG
jgi:hypothetical protein